MISQNARGAPEALWQRALALHASGRITEAAVLYQQLINAFPRHPQLHSNLGNIQLMLGRLDEGVRLLQRSLDIDPNQPAVLNNLGIALHRLQRSDEALKCLARAVLIKPDYAQAYHNTADIFTDLKKFPEALDNYRQAIRLQPEYVEAHINLGAVLLEQNKFDDALMHFDRAISLQPNFAEAHSNRGTALHKLKKFGEALDSYERAIALQPDNAEAYNNKGAVLRELQQFDRALASYDHAIGLNAGFVEAYVNRGTAFKDLSMFDAALADFDRAIQLSPGYADAYYNKGNVLLEIGDFYEALDCYERAIQLNPDHAESHYNKGNALLELKSIDEALACYDRAIDLKSDYAEPHWNKAFIKILKGEYQEGWQLYEWRWNGPQKDFVRQFTQPLWQGDQPIEDKTILIHAEQGLGDVIQFSRYFPMLEKLGARVIVEVPASLTSLIATLRCTLAIVEKGQPLPDFDVYCPVMSLPLAFRTTLSTVPAEIPYLHADSGKLDQWREILGESSGKRIGLAWSGSATHKNDRNRSIPLRLLEPLLGLPVEYHMLQIETRPSDAPILESFKRITSHQGEIHDFADTAALVGLLDLVITVDTSVAHLAGALGKPVWVLLPYLPDYRWMLDRRDTPWYPSATLFRQSERGNWTDVIAEVAAKIRAMMP